jgi:Protein of unknown function (DUF2442)
MNSSKSGIVTSVCNITGINDLGFWVLAAAQEYFVPFSDYPGFKIASVNQIFNVRFLPPSQLHWEELDMDIELLALARPESFPLVFKK